MKGLLETLLRLLVRHAEPGELGVAIALADAELQTAAGHQIEGRYPGAFQRSWTRSLRVSRARSVSMVSA
jgi:hypothetical protein